VRLSRLRCRVEWAPSMGHNKDINVSDTFVSVSTEGSAPAAEYSAISVVTEQHTEHVLSQDVRNNTTHLLSGQQSQSDPLARIVSKRERPLSSWLWSDEFMSQSSQPQSIDLIFERRISRGVTIMEASVPSWVSEGRGRQPGTLNSAKHPRSLETDGEGARLRRQHIRQAITRSPVLEFTHMASSIYANRLRVYHNALRSELQSLYIIVSSLEKRMLDVNENDIEALYAWLATFGDLIRVYFCASERHVLNIIEDASDSELRDGLCSTQRKREKLRIIKILEDIEAMKRPMVARPQSCENVLPALVVHIDKFSMALLRYINSEIEQIPTILTNYFHADQLLLMFRELDLQLLQCPSGHLLQAMLARGSSEKTTDQGRWLKHQIHALLGAKRLRPPLEVQRWSRMFVNVHMKYVSGFAKAESEYKRLYE
jgi:hypothetical protein